MRLANQLLAVLLAAGAVVWAQDAPPVPAGDPASQNAVPKSGTSNDRLFSLLPNFLTLENADHVPPMKPKQKFVAVAKGAFDWGQFIWYGALSGLSQAENSEPGFGQGWKAYGKRYGAALADGSIENFMVGAALPSLFRQDPRFYQKSNGSAWHRLAYAASRIVITRGDSGKPEFNFSEIVGSAMSAGISTYSYHPRTDRTVSNTASVWATQLGYDTMSIVFKEFWPDIRKKIWSKGSKGSGAGSGAAVK